MRPGIEIIKESVGTGAEAVKGKTVVINLRMFLLDGKEIASVKSSGQGLKVNLAKRHTIAGLRYGLEGMKVGGHREFVMGSHLGYGEKGLAGEIPPNSKLRCQVELLDVRENGNPRPEDYPPGKQIVLIHPGELSRSIPKIQFGLQENGDVGAFVTVPIPGMKWRNSRSKVIRSNIPPERCSQLISWVERFPIEHPKECLSTVHSEGGDSSWYTDEEKNEVCFYFSIHERGRDLVKYYIPESSQHWNQSELHQVISDLLKSVVR